MFNCGYTTSQTKTVSETIQDDTKTVSETIQDDTKNTSKTTQDDTKTVSETTQDDTKNTSTSTSQSKSTTTSSSTSTDQSYTQVNSEFNEPIKDLFSKIKSLVGSGNKEITTTTFATEISNYVRDYYINNLGMDSSSAEEIRKYIYDDLTTGEAKDFLDEYLHTNNSDDDFNQWVDYIIGLTSGEQSNDQTYTNINFTSDEQRDVFNKIKSLVGTGNNKISVSSFATQISNFVKDYCIKKYEIDSNEAESLKQYIYNDLTSGEAKEFLDEYLHVNNPDYDLIDWADYIINLVVEFQRWKFITTKFISNVY